jgi:hypothetical protein
MFVKSVLGQVGVGHYEVPHHTLHIPCLALRNFQSRLSALIVISFRILILICVNEHRLFNVVIIANCVAKFNNIRTTVF